MVNYVSIYDIAYTALLPIELKKKESWNLFQVLVQLNEKFVDDVMIGCCNCYRIDMQRPIHANRSFL